MRILHVMTSIDPATGGPANVLARLSSVQSRCCGHDITIVTADAPESVKQVTQSLAQHGVKLQPGGPTTGVFAKGVHVKSCIDQWIAAGSSGIVHIHGLWQHTPHYGASAAAKAGLPYIIRPCGMLDPWSLSQSRLKKRLFLAFTGKRDLNSAAALHFTTQTEQNLVSPLNLKSRGFVIPNGVDWSEFESLPVAGQFRAAHGIGDGPLVVFLSRLHHKKGLDLLIPAFAECGVENAHLALVGPGDASYVQSLKDLASQHSISDRVHFPGMMRGADRITALADADLFCLPSYQENFGVSVVEALAAGTPVLISDQVNIHHAITRANVGTVVPCAVEPLAKAMGAMLSDRSALAHQGAAGRDWVSRTFRWEAIAQQVDAMYQAITSPAPTGS